MAKKKKAENVSDLTDEKALKIAAVAHSANREWCRLHGDLEQPAWEFAPKWQVESAVAGVMAIASGTVKTPEESHESWMKHKIDTGWTYGPQKHPQAKEHPCLVPYEELPEEQRAKDALFHGIVKIMLDV